MTPEAFERAVMELLETEAVLTLATCQAGVPWASDVYFAPLGHNLVFFSSPRSRHARNLAANPACAAAVRPRVASWKDIRGLQMEGVVQRPETLTAKAEALAAYVRKFPFTSDLLADPGDVARKMARVAAHVFCPRRIRYLDNALGFASRFVVEIKDGAPLGPPVPEESAESVSPGGPKSD